MSKRIKIKYPGVFYREVNRIGIPGKERVYYVVFKKEGKVLKEKARPAEGLQAAPWTEARLRFHSGVKRPG